MRITKTIYVFLCIIFLSGCLKYKMDKTAFMKEIPPHFQYHKYEKGKEVESFKVGHSDMLYKKLILFINETSNSWDVSFITYAPCHVFYSENMNINIQPGLIIINFKQKNKKWKQITQMVSQTSWNF